MNLNEIDAAIVQAVSLLREARDAIRPFRPESPRFGDEVENAFQLVGGAAYQAQKALETWHRAVREVRGE